MKYKREAEGAVFETRRSRVTTSQVSPLLRRVTTLAQYNRLLSDLDGSAQAILKANRIDPTTKASELPEDCSEVVREAHEIAELIEHLRRHVSKAADPEYARELVALAFGLGQCSFQMLLRLDGTEGQVYGRKKQQKNLIAQRIAEIDADLLRDAWIKVSQLNPAMKKKERLEMVADQFHVSLSTIKRRMKSFNLS